MPISKQSFLGPNKQNTKVGDTVIKSDSSNQGYEGIAILSGHNLSVLREIV